MMMPRDPQTGVVDVAMQNLAFNLLDSLFTIKCHNLLVAATGSRMATFMDLVRGLCWHGQQAATAWNMQHQHGMFGASSLCFIVAQLQSCYSHA